MAKLELSVSQIERLIDYLGAVGDETDDNDQEIMSALEEAYEAEKNRLEGLPA